MEEKIALIDQICTLHPAQGVKVGWSTYTGGMMDTGRWYFRKMLDIPIEELQAFWEEKSKPYVPELDPIAKELKDKNLTPREFEKEYMTRLEAKIWWESYEKSNN